MAAAEQTPASTPLPADAPALVMVLYRLKALERLAENQARQMDQVLCSLRGIDGQLTTLDSRMINIELRLKART